MIVSSVQRVLLGVLTIANTFVVEGAVELDPYAVLGLNDLTNTINLKYDVTVDDNCHYEVNMSFQHNHSFPLGGPDTCAPGVIAEEDGLTMLEGRWMYERFPKYIRDATGLDHPSLDWNPCGHPGPGFLTPHYDIHMYTVSPSYRAFNMTCVLIPGTPVCDSEWQEEDSGRGFFKTPHSTINPERLKNVPPEFEFFITDAVIFMGLHGHVKSKEPASPAEWIDPMFVMVQHDANIICVEPMIPLHFVMGDVDQYYEEDLVYIDQDVDTLPYYYSTTFTAATGTTSFVFKGESATCKDEFDILKENYDPLTDPELLAKQEQQDARNQAAINARRQSINSNSSLNPTLMIFIIIIPVLMLMFVACLHMYQLKDQY